MSATATPDSFNIKHRLVGAILLITLGIVVVPMVLNGNGSSDSKTVVIETPSQQRAPREFISRIQPMGETRKQVTNTEDGQTIQFNPAPAAPAQQPAATSQSTDSSSVQAGQAEPDTTAAVVPTPRTSSEPAAKISAAPEAEQSNAKPVEPTVVDAGAQTRQIKVAKAETKQPKVTKAVPAKPAASPQESKSASSLAVKTDRGWIVRIGAFGDPTNARNITRILKSKGFEPSSTQQKTKEGKVITRVWVGPYGERVTAGRIQDKIERATGEKGFITPYP